MYRHMWKITIILGVFEIANQLLFRIMSEWHKKKERKKEKKERKKLYLSV